ncbi:hypothetical protein B0H13DRAFT_2316249 [Mycena leptocephala]|nr:hypothetical protein B0H13DRAFT_2316249 [Mycena leptocephala]
MGASGAGEPPTALVGSASGTLFILSNLYPLSSAPSFALITELSWTPPESPILAHVNKSLKGKWAALACYEAGSLIVQNVLEKSAKDVIIDELLEWRHVLEHGSEEHRQMALEQLLNGLLVFERAGGQERGQGAQGGGKGTIDCVAQRMCEPAKVDLALSLTGSQLIASFLPTADKNQHPALYDRTPVHIVVLRGCKTGSRKARSHQDSAQSVPDTVTGTK